MRPGASAPTRRARSCRRARCGLPPRAAPLLTRLDALAEQGRGARGERRSAPGGLPPADGDIDAGGGGDRAMTFIAAQKRCCLTFISVGAAPSFFWRRRVTGRHYQKRGPRRRSTRGLPRGIHRLDLTGPCEGIGPRYGHGKLLEDVKEDKMWVKCGRTSCSRAMGDPILGDRIGNWSHREGLAPQSPVVERGHRDAPHR